MSGEGSGRLEQQDIQLNALSVNFESGDRVSFSATPGTNERIVKFDRNGNYVMEWGVPGFGACGSGQFSSLHALEIDSQGRLFIGDRDNNRIQIYDQDGNYLECWYQFGRPSGIHIDSNDNIYVADSESSTELPEYGGPPSPFDRGIRVGSATDGSVAYFIPDPEPQGGSSAAEGVAGNCPKKPSEIPDCVQIRLTDPTANRVGTIEIDIDLAGGWVGPGDGSRRVQATTWVQPKLRNYLSTILNVQQKRYDMRD